jgi:N-acyl-L-homoserine lactone synthetase
MAQARTAKLRLLHGAGPCHAPRGDLRRQTATGCAAAIGRSEELPRLRTAPHDRECHPQPDDRLGAIQRLRYEVYCLERKFRDTAECPDGLERDEYDPHSIHLCATDDAGAVAGTVRLVRHSDLGLPVQRYAELSIPAQNIPPNQWAEISRLIVAKRYRRPTLDQPLLLWGLFGRMFEESRRRRIRYLVAAMDKTLWRLLRRFGFPFVPVGEPIDYFGPVVPYGAMLDSLEPGYQKIRAYLRQVADTRPELADKFRLSVAA